MQSGSRIAWRVGTIVVVVVIAGLIVAWAYPGRVGEPVVDVQAGNAQLGRDAIREFGCISCHSVPGVTGADTWVGPPLDNWADRHYIAGRVPNDPETLVLFLLDPKYVDPETAMPVTGLTEDEARNIAAYLYTLTAD